MAVCIMYWVILEVNPPPRMLKKGSYVEACYIYFRTVLGAVMFVIEYKCWKGTRNFMNSVALSVHTGNTFVIADRNVAEKLVVRNFMLFIPCIVQNQPTTLNHQNTQYSSLDIYSIILHWVFLHVPVHKGSASGNQYQIVLHKTKLAIFINNERGVKESSSEM
jgi:hypothetical protein